MATTDDDGPRHRLYDEAKMILVREQRPSVSLLQRMLRLGYNDALRLMDSLEANGVVTAKNDAGFRTLTAAFQDQFDSQRLFKSSDKPQPS